MLQEHIFSISAKIIINRHHFKDMFKNRYFSTGFGDMSIGRRICKSGSFFQKEVCYVKVRFGFSGGGFTVGGV